MAHSLLRSLIYYTVFSFVVAFAIGAEKTVASKFKAPNEKTPSDVKKRWKEHDEALWSYVAAKIPDVLEHTGSSAFDEHLRGVQAVLRHFGAPDHLTSAGLFHSIYGTEGFQGFSLPLSERPVIQNLIGEKAEKLCFIYCMVDRFSVDETVLAWRPGACSEDNRFLFKSRPELGRFDIELSKEEWLDFIELTFADWMEQVEGAAQTALRIFNWQVGDAYAYRRLAYRKMSELLAYERASRLSQLAPQLLEAVMATEPQETRHLVQPRTPPMSEAAAFALTALRAAGENIPLDLESPQPVDVACEAK